MTSLNKENLSPAAFIGVRDNDIISFGSGEPDLPPPEEVYKIRPHYKDFKYGVIQETDYLRKVLTQQYPNSSVDSFVITNGASEELDMTLRVISNYEMSQSKKVLMTKPYYYSYPHLVECSGMEPVYIKTNLGQIDMDDFRGKVKDCRAVLINSPSNPTGRVKAISTLK